MANVLNRSTLEFRRSVNTPDFDELDYVINPDMSAVAGIPNKYWKLTGDVVSVMTSAEQAIVNEELNETRIQNLSVPDGTLLQYTFGDPGSNIQNKWLQISGTTGLASNETPLIIGYYTKLRGIQWGNSKPNVSTELEIHSLLNDTSSVRFSQVINNRSEFINLSNQLITFHPEEQIGVYLKRINNDRPTKVSVTLFLMITDRNEGNYSGNNNTILS